LVLGGGNDVLPKAFSQSTYSPFCGGRVGLGGTALPISIETQKNAKLHIATQNDAWRVMPVLCSRVCDEIFHMLGAGCFAGIGAAAKRPSL